MTWCDAFGFCSANKKRLCGKVGGGALRDPLLRSDLPPAAGFDFGQPRINEWKNACTAGGTRERPYGGDYAPGKCLPTTDASNTSTFPFEEERCPGGFDGVVGMIENGGELYDLCWLNLTSSQETLPDCVYGYGTEGDSCGDGSLDFPESSPAVSFRCCADALP